MNDKHDNPQRVVAALRSSLEHAKSPPDVPEHGAGDGALSADQIQVDVGGYQIFQGDAHGHLIAELFVEVDPHDPSNDRVRIEHWGLYPTEGWITPSRDYPAPPALAFVRIDGVAWASSGDFREHLKSRANVTYIQARCETIPL